MQTGLLNIKGALGAGEFQLLYDKTIGDDIYTKLLLHFEDTNGMGVSGQVDWLLDSGQSNKTVTSSGTVSLSTSTVKVGTGSALFDGSNYLTVPDSADWNFGTGDFTIDFWFRVNTLTDPLPLIQQYVDATHKWMLYHKSDEGNIKFMIQDTSTTMSLQMAFTPVINTWYHFALVRTGTSTWYSFINGVAIAVNLETGSFSANIPDFVAPLAIGLFGTSSYFNGYLDEVRISKGIARWTTTFTPQTTRYSTDAYTMLLLHFDTADTSACRRVATFQGTAQLQTSVYKVTPGNGAAKFNGSTSYLAYPDSADWDFGAGDFTIDCWVNFLTLSGDSKLFVGQWTDDSNNWYFGYGTSVGLYFVVTSVGSTPVNFNQGGVSGWSTGVWYHIAIVRYGNVWTIYRNGTSLGTQTVSVTIPNCTKSLILGMWNGSSNAGWFYGYMDEVRISKGIARWTTTFTPQTTPYTTDSYTKLLCHFDLDFNDSSGTGYTVSPSGSPSVAARYKFGTGAAKFSGSSSYLSVPDSADWDFGAGDFTLETWWMLNTTGAGAAQTFFSQYQDGTHQIYFQWVKATNKLLFYAINGANVLLFSAPFTPSLSIFYHIALVRNVNTWYMFVDGVSKVLTLDSGSYSITLPDAAAVLEIGGYNGPWSLVDGYLDEVRVSKGIARWTSGFTPPVAAYTTDSYTKLLMHMDDDGARDSSGLCKVVTNVGVNADQRYKFGNASAYFNGASAYLTFPDSDDWDFGSGNFTIDCWYRYTGATNPNRRCEWFMQRSGGSDLIQFACDSSAIYFVARTTASGYLADYEYTWASTTDTWYHIAIVRNGTALTLYINGAAITWTNIYTAIASNVMPNISAALTIGNNIAANGYGWVDEVRISKGIARWTSTFTPPTSAYTTDSYTKLLLHMDETTYLDASGVNYPVTISGGVTISGSVYVRGTGSALFNGSTGYLTVPDSNDWYLGTVDWTIDTWLRFSSVAASSCICSQYDGVNDFWYIVWVQSTKKLYFRAYSAGNAVGIFYCSWAPVVNTWYHVVVSRYGSTCLMFINGLAMSVTQSTAFGTIPNLTGVLRIGYDQVNSYYHNGYMDEFRISRGIARWTATFSTPYPINYTTDTYTKLLLHFDGDTTGSSNAGHPATNVGVLLETPKIGTSSLFFNGTSAYLTVPDSPDWYFQGGNFTIDFWVMFNTLPTAAAQKFIVGPYDSTGNKRVWGATVFNNGTNYNIRLLYGTAGGATGNILASSSVSLSTSTWYHIAIVRSGNTLGFYLDGVASGTASMTGITLLDLTVVLAIGAMDVPTGPGSFLNGWIDELRISKGIARWTAAFTPQTTAYTPDIYTVLLLHGDNLTDSSASGYDVTNTGVIMDTVKFGTSCALLNSATSDYFTVTDTSDFDFGYGDFTLEGWFKTSTDLTYIFMAGRSGGGASQLDVLIGASHVGRFQCNVYIGVTAYWVESATLVNNGVWHHFAFVRYNNMLYLYIDGISEGTPMAISGAINYMPSYPFKIGACEVGGGAMQYYWNGYLDELRISKGIARYTANFTPQTTAHVTDSYTKLLLHFDSNLTDSSARGYVPTNTATLRSRYGYFGDSGLLLDGNSDYVTIPDSLSWAFGDSSFTIDLWFMALALPAPSSSNYFVSQFVSADDQVSFGIYNNAGVYQIYFGVNSATEALINKKENADIVIETWYHVAVVRNVNSWSFYLNGVQCGSATTLAITMPNLATAIAVGARSDGGYAWFNGYLDEVRISRTARWAANFTPPTTQYVDDTQSAVTSLSITGLDGNTDKEYFLVTRFINGYNGTNDFALRFNNDAGANYGVQKLIGAATSLTTSRATTNTGIEVCNASALDYITMGKTHIYAKSGFPRSVLVQDIHDTFGTAVNLIDVKSNVWNNSLDNITSLSITADHTNGIGVESQVLLFVKRLTTGSGMMTGTLVPLTVAKGIGIVKIYSSTLASAATSVTISGLNGDTDDIYLVQCKIINGYSGSSAYRIRPNNDTGLNYGHQYMDADGATPTAARSTTATGMEIGNVGATALNQVCQSETLLYARSGYARTGITQVASRISGTTVGAARCSGLVWNNSSAIITSLVLVADQTNGLGVGTLIELFALRKAT